MASFFVTGSGTDVGKTFVTQGLIGAFRQQGMAVRALKPVATGFDSARAAESDPALLLQALGRPVIAAELDRISPWRFTAPLSPDMAARREGRAIDFAALVAACRAGVSDEILLIEGVGGVMVPLDAQHTVADWIAALRYPTVLVTGSYLGAISHTLTALDVLIRRDIAIAALIVSESAGSSVPLAETAEVIARFAKGTSVFVLPRIAEPMVHPTFAAVADVLRNDRGLP